MFREEFLVYLDVRDPHHPDRQCKAQLLVDEREVSGVKGTPKRREPVDAWLRVTLLRHQGEWADVVLPQPSQPLGDRVLVAGDSLREAPLP
jgi:hypothetical protein